MIGFVLSVAALRASYPVTMPALFAGMIVAALWPLKCWLQRWVPSWLSYALTVLALLIMLAGFAAAVYLSIGQLVTVAGDRWPQIEELYASAAGEARQWGIRLNGAADRNRILGAIQMLASGAYSFATYTGFIGLLVVLGLPEVPRLRQKMNAEMDGEAREKLRDTVSSISEQVRGYFGVTLATSVLTGVASTGWALMTGLELPFVWGLLNFLLNFVPVIGNIIGIVPPVLYAFLQFGGFGMPLLVFVGFAILQIAISNFVYPILQGRQLSLSPLAIVMAMTFWGWIWGVTGALIAVPLTAAVVIVCGHFDRSRWVAKILSA
nr:AI-2E family transporter [Sphingomonas xinjiangensis]